MPYSTVKPSVPQSFDPANVTPERPSIPSSISAFHPKVEGIPQIFPTRQRRPRVTRAEGREAPEPANSNFGAVTPPKLEAVTPPS